MKHRGPSEIRTPYLWADAKTLLDTWQAVSAKTPLQLRGIYMQSTMELFNKALEVKQASAWARDFNITPETFSMAKKAGRLSPLLAGNIAMELGEDTDHWIAVAALEAQKPSPLLARLRQHGKC